MSFGKSFGNKIKQWIEKAKQTPSLAIHDSTKELFSLIVKRTPVLTGELINNWNASNDMYQFVNRSPAKDGKDALASIAALTPGKVYWFVNNRHYILEIEYEGKSRVKAPLGMVHISLAEYVGILAASVASISKKKGWLMTKRLIWR